MLEGPWVRVAQHRGKSMPQTRFVTSSVGRMSYGFGLSSSPPGAMETPQHGNVSTLKCLKNQFWGISILFWEMPQNWKKLRDFRIFLRRFLVFKVEVFPLFLRRFRFFFFWGISVFKKSFLILFVGWTWSSKDIWQCLTQKLS